ncbi:sugar ABC transporter substrate-binding protein [Paludisphaera sp.]|uniref:sugar ABC transporter substrate-binding protein n=1 Tax=Paludisphaera sp. TaxID=2017432 RepID=UPI00301D2B88
MSRRTPIAALALLLLAGCGGGESAPGAAPGSASSPAPATPGKPRIALVMKSLANEFFSVMAEGARKYQSEHADEFDLLVNGIKDERDIARQVALMEDMIGQKVDAIVIAPADSKALVSVCRRAQEAGIAVVNIDNKLDDAVLAEQGVKIPFVGPDNRAGAKLVGDYVAGKLQPGDPVAIVEGLKTAFNGQQRLLGFQDSAKAADLKVVDSQSAQWEIAQANRVASAMLSEHPEIKALLCCNDSMALGALAAVKSAGRSGQVHIVGYDGIAAVRQAIQDGTILATVDQHADQLAVFGLQYALDLVARKETPADRTTPVDLVVKE